MQLQSAWTSKVNLLLSRRQMLKLSGIALLTTQLPASRLPSRIEANTMAGPRFPFPQHTLYTQGTIRPSHQSQMQLDNAVKLFYKLWRKRYLKRGCGRGRYYILAQSDGGGGDPNTITISEGHGYGMVLMALMAGYEPKAQTIFDGMYDFFRDHPSEINPNLMAWNQVDGCGNSRDADSATDGDMDIAYALLLADKQWGSSGRINYRAAAHQLIEAGLLASVVHPMTYHLTLGDWANADEPRLYNATRPSDFMINHLRTYHAATGNAGWQRVLDTCYSLIERMQSVYSPATGLLPDFIQDVNRQARPAVGELLEEKKYDGTFYYNACRTPWRLGTDYLISGDQRAYQAVNRMTHWIKQNTGANPSRIRAGYYLDGRNLPGNNYLPMAFLAPFGVGAMVDRVHQSWLNAIWDLVVVQGVNATDYYGNTLKLLTMVVMSGNWWSPETINRQRGDTADATSMDASAEDEFEEIEFYPDEFATSETEDPGKIYLPLITR